MYGDPEHDMNLAALPSTSFGSGGDDLDDDLQFKKGKHRKSKSYANISDFERGRRRESGRKSKDVDPGMFFFHGQQSDPAGRDSLRQSRGYSNENGPRRDSRNPATLPNRSFHRSFDPDEHIPLDTEPHPTHSDVRDSMGPEDEELFAGPSLALYSFEPENANELRLVEGQEIMVSYRHGQGWLVASDPRTDEQGLVPEAYVRLIADMPNYDPETGQFMDIDEMEDSEMQQDSEINHDEAHDDADNNRFFKGNDGSSRMKAVDPTQDSTGPEPSESGQNAQTNTTSDLNRDFDMDQAFEDNRAEEANQTAQPTDRDPNIEKYRTTVYDDNGVINLDAATAVSDSPVPSGSEDEDENPMRWMEAKRLKRIQRTGKD